MSIRFKYEAPNPFLKVALTLTAPRRWRSRARPWIFDRVTGVRFQPSEDEDAALSKLSGSTDDAFDRLVLAIMDRRRGYVCDWSRLANGLKPNGKT